MKKRGRFLVIGNQKEYLRFIDINSLDFSLDLKYEITSKQVMERSHAFLKVIEFIYRL